MGIDENPTESGVGLSEDERVTLLGVPTLRWGGRRNTTG
jgi:hypothetical protein